MSTEIEIREEKQETFDIQKNNEYSIYDYLKNNPSILITLVSAIVAIVTFFAKSIMTISIRNELEFWEFNYRNFLIGNESLFLNATVLLIYSVLSSFCTICILDTYDAYLPFKEKHLMLNYRVKFLKKEIKEIKKKILDDSAKDTDKLKYDSYNDICVANKEMGSDLKKYLLINIIPLLVVLLIINFLYAVISAKNYNDIFRTTIVYILSQCSTIFVFFKIREKKIINRKKIKKECFYGSFIKEPSDFKIPPLTLLISKGLRHVLKNDIIIVAIVVFFISSSFICITNGLIKTDLTETNGFYRITEFDNVVYAVVYQNGNQYFLEEIEIKNEKIPEGKTHKNLIIYADCQRIVISNDMSIELYKYDDVKKGYRLSQEE